MNKKLGLIGLIIGILVLLVGVVFIINDKEETPKDNPSQDNPSDKPGEEEKDKPIKDIQTEEVTKKEINELIDTLFKDNVTKKELEKIVGTNIENYYIYYGKDSYVRTGFTFNLKGLEEYDKKLDQYADKLEKVIKDNFEVVTNEYIVSEEGDIIQRLRYKSYYYICFINDYMSLRDKLLTYTDLNIEQINLGNMTEEDKIKVYKINVKALEIMSNHFDDYKNNNEYIDYELFYTKKDTIITNDYFSLLINLSGNFYKNASYATEQERIKLENDRFNRVKNIFDKAVASGNFDTSNPYKLK